MDQVTSVDILNFWTCDPSEMNKRRHWRGRKKWTLWWMTLMNHFFYAGVCSLSQLSPVEAADGGAAPDPKQPWHCSSGPVSKVTSASWGFSDVFKKILSNSFVSVLLFCRHLNFDICYSAYFSPMFWGIFNVNLTSCTSSLVFDHLSVSCNLTVLAVLLLSVCLYIPGLVVCKRADTMYQKNRRAHFLSDNSPFDSCLYAVTVHTGLCSAANMSAKVKLPFAPFVTCCFKKLVNF